MNLNRGVIRARVGNDDGAEEQFRLFRFTENSEERNISVNNDLDLSSELTLTTESELHYDVDSPACCGIIPSDYALNLRKSSEIDQNETFIGGERLLSSQELFYYLSWKASDFVESYGHQEENIGSVDDVVPTTSESHQPKILCLSVFDYFQNHRRLNQLINHEIVVLIQTSFDYFSFAAVSYFLHS